MRVIITKIGNKTTSKHGGKYCRVIFKGIEDNKNYMLDVYDSNMSSVRWKPYLKEQAMFSNVDIFSGKFLSGYSQFKFLGIKQKENTIQTTLL
jgi:hypothetical protein